MPVGRFVLDVHGEDPRTWPANDALCAALQVINHLQDCGKDYRNLDRVYIPLDALAAAGIGAEDADGTAASPALRASASPRLPGAPTRCCDSRGRSRRRSATRGWRWRSA